MKEYKFYKRHLININIILIIFLLIFTLLGVLIFTIYHAKNFDYYYLIFFIFMGVIGLFIFYNESKNYIKDRLCYLNYIKKILSKKRYAYFDYLFIDFYTGMMRRELKKINKRVTISIGRNNDNEPSNISIRGIYCKNEFNQIHIKKNLILLEDYLGDKSLRLHYKDIFSDKSLINIKNLIEIIMNEMSLGSDKNLYDKNIANLENIKNKLCRKATLMQIGDPTDKDDDIYSSWFGKVLLSLPNEEWPTSKGEPMVPLCQINVTQLPYIPEDLNGIEFITIFIGPNELPFNDANGENWCLRAYKTINDLVPLEQVNTSTQIIPHPIKGQLIEEDYPSLYDYLNLKENNKEISLPKEVEDEYEYCFQNVNGFKIGGWPTLLQSEIFWGPGNQLPIKPQFVFQIDSITQCNFFWGDDGVGYFGRGSVDGFRDEWVIEWQCW